MSEDTIQPIEEGMEADVNIDVGAGADQGTMTSPTFNAMLARAIASAHPDLYEEGLEKVALLTRVLDARGWRAVVALGCAIEDLAAHPVIDTITTPDDPEKVLERWMRLERFGHTRNFTTIDAITRDEGSSLITVHHVARDGGPIMAVNDLFIWGVILGLLRAAGILDTDAVLAQEDGGEVVVWRGGCLEKGSQALPAMTYALRLRSRIDERPDESAKVTAPASFEAPGDVAERLGALVSKDLLERWTLARAARAMATSPRSLQRALREEETTFSETIQRARVDAAYALLTESHLRLVDIAFCVGFSDQAHFTRIFRRLCDVPPSALRDLEEDTSA